MTTYTADEMVRLELLSYRDPDGLHPIEKAWRELARKLMEQVMEAEEITERAVDKVSYKSEEQRNWKPYPFPKPFKPVVS